jgi:RNA polymerase sigma factor (TIGR02999 family)
MSDVTHILSAIQQGDPHAAKQLLPLVYDELRKLAAHRLAREAPGQTLQATALVHEAYVRLVDGEQVRDWDGRGHFFAAAAEAMRRILVERARHKKSLKAGGDRRRVEMADAELVTEEPCDDLLGLDAALEKLEQLDKRKADLVKLRFFAGLTNEQAAAALGVSASTADNDWAYAGPGSAWRSIGQRAASRGRFGVWPGSREWARPAMRLTDSSSFLEEAQTRETNFFAATNCE